MIRWQIAFIKGENRANQAGKDEFSFGHTEFEIIVFQWRCIISVAINKLSYYRRRKCGMNLNKLAKSYYVHI